jgi:hypothetical protein
MDTDTCPPNLLVSQVSPPGVDVSLPPPGWRTLVALLRQPGVSPTPGPFLTGGITCSLLLIPVELYCSWELSQIPKTAIFIFDGFAIEYKNRCFLQNEDMDGENPVHILILQGYLPSGDVKR